MKISTNQKINKTHIKLIPLFILLLGIVTINAQVLTINSSAAGNSNTVCKGDQVTFTSSYTAGSPSPCHSSYLIHTIDVYEWSINGNPVIGGSGTNNYYITNSLKDGDIVTCAVTSFYVCPQDASPNNYNYTYNSQNSITMHVISNRDDFSISGETNAETRLTYIYSVLAPSVSVPNLIYTWSPNSTAPAPGDITPIGSDGLSVNIQMYISPVSTNVNNIKLSVYPAGCPALVKNAYINVKTYNPVPSTPYITESSTNPGSTGPSIDLSWNGSTDDNGSIQNYIVHYKEITPSSTDPGSSQIVGASPTSYQIPGLTDGSTYELYVVAKDNDNALSANSNKVNFTIDHMAPTTPGMLNIIEQTDNTVTLMWNPSPDNVATTGYEIFRNGTKIATIGTNNFYTAFIGTIPARFSVDAFDAKGNTSGLSSEVLVTQKVNPFTIDTVTGFVGIGVNPPSDKLDVDGTLKVRGDIVMEKAVQNTPDVFSFTGSSLDFFTPVQAQWNGNKPVLSMSQYGEMSFFSTPYLNYNDIKFLGTGNYVNGIGYRDAFGTISGIGGPTLYGANGGALGTKQGSWNGPEQVALNWDNNSNITTSGILYTKGGLKLPDGSLLKSSQGLVTNGQSNVTFSDKLQVVGTDPYFRIGSLVMQDLTSSTSTTRTTDMGSGTETQTDYLITPEAFVFGNMYFDVATQTYKSIFDISDSTIVVDKVNGTGSIITNTYLNNQNGGTALNFNSASGNIEFIAIPSVAGQFVNHQWSIDKSLIGNYKRMVIGSNGDISIGKNIIMTGTPNVNYLQFPDGTQQFTAGAGTITLWQKYLNSMYVNSGVKVGIGTTNPGYPLDVEGTTGVDAIHIGRGNLKVIEDANFSGKTTLQNLTVNGSFLAANSLAIPSSKEVFF